MLMISRDMNILTMSTFSKRACIDIDWVYYHGCHLHIVTTMIILESKLFWPLPFSNKRFTTEAQISFSWREEVLWWKAQTSCVWFDKENIATTYIPGMLAPPHPGLPGPAPRKALPPRPAEINKTRGAQRGKANCRFQDKDLIPLFIMSTNFVLEQERVGKAFH